MSRLLAATLAGIVSLVGLVAVYAAVSWFMQSAAFAWVAHHPRSGQMIAVMTAVIWPAVIVPLSIISQRRRKPTDRAEQTELVKPAPRLWLRAFERHDD